MLSTDSLISWIFSYVWMFYAILVMMLIDLTWIGWMMCLLYACLCAISLRLDPKLMSLCYLCPLDSACDVIGHSACISVVMCVCAALVLVPHVLWHSLRCLLIADLSLCLCGAACYCCFVSFCYDLNALILLCCVLSSDLILMKSDCCQFWPLHLVQSLPVILCLWHMLELPDACLETCVLMPACPLWSPLVLLPLTLFAVLV